MSEVKLSNGLLLVILFFLLAGCSSVKNKTSSDIVVLPLGNEVRVTDGSLVYALPMTLLEFEITAEKNVSLPGPYAAWAGEMIGLDNVITARNESWVLKSVKMRSVEESDPSQYYVIEGTTLMQTNMLALRRSGLVLDINPSSERYAAYQRPAEGPESSDPIFPDRGATEYISTNTDTAYRLVKADTIFIRIPYLVQKKRGMPEEERAREAAEKLLDLREGRHMILTGETNIFPQNDAALKEIERLEREYTALFAGKSWRATRQFKVWVVPDRQMAGGKSTIFTFSRSGGINSQKAADAVPVEMEITPSGKTRDLNLVTRPPASTKVPSTPDKLYYRIPDVAEIVISMDNEILSTSRLLIYQYGTLVTLPSNFIIGR